MSEIKSNSSITENKSNSSITENKSNSSITENKFDTEIESETLITDFKKLLIKNVEDYDEKRKIVVENLISPLLLALSKEGKTSYTVSFSGPTGLISSDAKFLKDFCIKNDLKYNQPVLSYFEIEW